MNITSQLNIKPLYRITGTPENFLTALRHFTWGFNDVTYWNNVENGDLIFFHSKASDSFFLSKSPSCIVGFGIVGSNFYVDTKPLWIDETLSDKKYPYKFSFSEIYLFSEIPVTDDWDSQTLNKLDNTANLLNRLVANGIPLRDLAGFPAMGSFSAINNEDVKKLLLSIPRSLKFYKNLKYDESLSKPSTELREVKTDYETLRHATSLTIFDDVQQKIINKSEVHYSYSLNDLKNAERHHFNIVAFLRKFFAEREYQVLKNNHIDLFAHNGKNALLIEAKSIENNNLISQSRDGIAKLFEFNYFELTKFKSDKNLKFENETKLLATSREPNDKEYVNFINSLNIRTLAVKENEMITYGASIDLNTL